MTDNISDAQAIIDNTMSRTGPSALPDTEGVFTQVVPSGAMHVLFDTDRWADSPRRKSGTVRMNEAGSLATYVAAHKTRATEIYANRDNLQIVGVINGDVPSNDEFPDAGWRDYRVEFAARHTKEWQAWSKIDHGWTPQAEFAQFIEDQAATIVKPSAADALELAQTFEAKADVEFKSAVRLADGTRQLTYNETVTAQAGKQGTMEVPERIELALRPFEGAAQYRVTARLRHRFDGGSLRLMVLLDRPDLVLDLAFADLLAEVEKTTEIVAYLGVPADARTQYGPIRNE